MHTRQLVKTASILVLAFVAPTSWAQDEEAITPYRPSVSSPAQLPAPGQLEFELGGLAGRSNGQRRDSLPYQFKLAFSPQWGVLLGGETFVSSRDDAGNRARGFGDTNLVLKRAFLIDDATAFGLEFGAKIPTARNDIGSGSSDYTINGIFSRDLGKVHMDTNLNFTRLGLVDEGTGRTQTGLSASFSTPISERWGATAELSGTRRTGADSTSQALMAASYSPSKRLTIDFGVLKGLNSASPNWSFFTGLVFPIAKLW